MGLAFTLTGRDGLGSGGLVAGLFELALEFSFPVFVLVSALTFSSGVGEASTFAFALAFALAFAFASTT